MATIKEEVHQITLTEAAALKVKGLAEQEGKKDSSLRVYISGGGCSGYSYGLTLDETISSNDLVFEEHGVKVLVDPESMKMLSGCVVDYTESLNATGFTVNNPNAESSCGCGHSFTPKEA
ncbi:MAG: iron-sulfur cluster insertion protein ErpA [Nitrososphaerales archaeon]